MGKGTPILQRFRDLAGAPARAWSEHAGEGHASPVRPIAGAVLLGLSAAALFLLLLPTSADTDIWGHVRFGQDLLAGGPLRPVDRYSYLTAGSRWINHETLAEVIFAMAFSAAGGAGLVALKVTVILAIAGLIIRHYRRAGASGGQVVMILVPATILAWPRFSTVRPQLFTALFLAVTLYVLLRVEEREDTRTLWLLPPLFGVWVNTHGGVLVGLAFLGCWALVRALVNRAIEWRVALPVLLCVLALLANPYGLALPLFLLRTATVPRPDIAEWQPLPLTNVFGAAYLVLVGLVMWGVHRRGLPRPTRLVMLITALLLPLLAWRHVDLCALGTVLLGRDELLAALPVSGVRSRRSIDRVLASLSISVAAGMVASVAPGSQCLRVHPGGMPVPARAIRTLASAGIEANMAVPIAWGEYVIWQLGPRVRVSIDGRRETVYSDSIRKLALDLESGSGDWQRIVRDPRTQLVLVRAASPPYNLLNAHGEWALAYADDQAALFALSGSELLSRIRATVAKGKVGRDPGRCFAAPGP